MFGCFIVFWFRFSIYFFLGICHILCHSFYPTQFVSIVDLCLSIAIEMFSQLVWFFFMESRNVCAFVCCVYMYTSNRYLTGAQECSEEHDNSLWCHLSNWSIGLTVVLLLHIIKICNFYFSLSCEQIIIFLCFDFLFYPLCHERTIFHCLWISYTYSCDICIYSTYTSHHMLSSLCMIVCICEALRVLRSEPLKTAHRLNNHCLQSVCFVLLKFAA